ncbi:MAG: helix-turn-helix transcriptional regulator [Syntrophorhabdales bacterium]|jgi:DNA-binding Xre family transcriptional regulator
MDRPESLSIEHQMYGKIGTFSVDVSAVRGREVQECLLALIRKLGYRCTSYDHFWGVFAKQPGKLPEGVLVLGDLSTIARRYAQFRPHHRWIASVRERRPYFIGLIRTRLDGFYIHVTNDLLRNSDMRATVCRHLDTDFPACLLKAASALKPDSLIDVRYSPLTHQLWVQFSDGLFGSVPWGHLGLQDEVRNLMLQTATLDDAGATVEIVRRGGDLFSICARSIRDALWASCQPGVSQAGVGDRVRSARGRAGISQSELAIKTGIHQTNISRLERGHHCPRFYTLERVAAALGCALTELLSEG